MNVDPTLLLLLDEAIRADMGAFEDRFTIGVLWSAAIVLVGVFLEGPEILVEIRKTRRSFSLTHLNQPYTEPCGFQSIGCPSCFHSSAGSY
jgi:hypothetical protein